MNSNPIEVFPVSASNDEVYFEEMLNMFGNLPVDKSACNDYGVIELQLHQGHRYTRDCKLRTSRWWPFGTMGTDVLEASRIKAVETLVDDEADWFLRELAKTKSILKTYPKSLFQDELDMPERDEIEAYNVYRQVYKKFMKSKNLNNLTLDELNLLEYKNFVDPKEDPDAPRDKDGNLLYHPRMVFLIVDDLIGSDAFSSTKRGNFLNRLAVKSRHESEDLVGMNLFFITQSFNRIIY